MAKKKQQKEREETWIDPSYEQQFDRLQGVKGSIHDDPPEDNTPDMRTRIQSRYPLVTPEPKQEVLPPIRQVPQVPVEVIMPGNVRQVETYSSNPITRAQAMIMKVNTVTVFLSILTGAAMLIWNLYPKDFAALGIFFLWLVYASLEWCALFAFLAILDHLETPASQNRKQWNDMRKMADREQRNRLKAMYGKDYEK